MPTYLGPRFGKEVPVFAMGSCFAREIEAALVRRGGNVISIDDSIKRPEFENEKGEVKTGFFHRYTPTSMAQEFCWPFDRQEGWSPDSLIFETSEGIFEDLNYGPTCPLKTEAAVRLRREVSG